MTFNQGGGNQFLTGFFGFFYVCTLFIAALTEQSKYWKKYLLTRVVETNSYGLYKNFQFEYCRRRPLPRFVLSCFLFCGMVRNGIPSCFLFRWKVRKGIPRVCFYFCSVERNSQLFLFRWRLRKGIPRVCFYFCLAERNSEIFSLPQRGSERNSEKFCSAEQPEFRRK